MHLTLSVRNVSHFQVPSSIWTVQGITYERQVKSPTRGATPSRIAPNFMFKQMIKLSQLGPEAA
jgi:hypothetical protein